MHNNSVYRKGDYYRYIAEFKTEEERKEAADQSLKGYQARPVFVCSLGSDRVVLYYYYLLLLFL